MSRAAALADHAVAALCAELALYPKPGLVSPVDSGSHRDMDAPLLRASAESLRDAFRELAQAGAAGAEFTRDLVPIGLRAEAHMLAVTGGVNTHRGAIFALGLLVAAVAAQPEEPPAPAAVRAHLRARWGEELTTHATRGPRAGAGARREAAAAFPAIFERALPHLRSTRAAGVAPEPAAIDTLFLLITTLPEDTNLLHRGGSEGGAFARREAGRFLAAGGVRAANWHPRAEEIHRAFVARNLSPGGAADLLAGTLFLDAVTSLGASFSRD